MLHGPSYTLSLCLSLSLSPSHTHTHTHAFLVEMGVKLDRDKPQLPSMAAPEGDEGGPVVWYHEGPPELTIARYWIADYSVSR